MESLQKSFDHCAQICANSGSNFISAFRLLPQRERHAMEAVYAFMRLADDLVDDTQSTDDARLFLGLFQTTFLEALKDPERAFSELPSSNSPILSLYFIFPAIYETIRQYSIPTQYFLDVLHGIQTDLEKNFFQTVEELENYCYHVASAVGLICLHIWGIPAAQIAPDADTPIFRAAVSCGKALQWTNILRDVLDDAQNDRLYLPLDDWNCLTLQRTKTSNQNPMTDEEKKNLSSLIKNKILAENCSDFLPVIKKNLARAERFYAETVPLAEWIPKRNRKVFLLMTSVYHRIFEKISQTPEIVFNQKVKLGKIEKIKLYFRIFFNKKFSNEAKHLAKNKKSVKMN